MTNQWCHDCGGYHHCKDTQHLRDITDALKSLISDNITRANNGQDVNWAIIHSAQETINKLKGE